MANRQGQAELIHSVTQKLLVMRRDLPHLQAGGSTYLITFRAL